MLAGCVCSSDSLSLHQQAVIYLDHNATTPIYQTHGVVFHCDAVQTADKVEIDVRKVPADCLSLTGHKFHAPKARAITALHQTCGVGIYRTSFQPLK
jgi:cysteine sulfinate desulfinase/cysteine desulfurase-like protein